MNKYLQLLQPNIDSFGFITQNASQNWDGGDSSQREGSFALLIEELYNQGKVDSQDMLDIFQRYEKNIDQIKCGLGGLRRHPDQSKWYGQRDVMSRDQWIPNVIACGNGLDAELRYLLLGHMLRALLFTTNTCPDWVMTGGPGYKWQLPDVTVLSSWGLYIRSFDCKLLWPLLLLFDLQTVVNSLIIVGNSMWNPTNTDVSNQLNTLIQAYRRMPTPFSWLARKILRLDKRGMDYCVDNYFSAASGAPALNVLYKEVWNTIG